MFFMIGPWAGHLPPKATRQQVTPLRHNEEVTRSSRLWVRPLPSATGTFERKPVGTVLWLLWMHEPTLTRKRATQTGINGAVPIRKASSATFVEIRRLKHEMAMPGVKPGITW